MIHNISITLIYRALKNSIFKIAFLSFLTSFIQLLSLTLLLWRELIKYPTPSYSVRTETWGKFFFAS